MKKIVISVLLFLCISVLQAQSKFQVILDYRYMLGLSEHGDVMDLSRKEAKMYGNALRLSCLYSLFSQVATGIGVGADRYEIPSYNTLPVFAIVHYNPNKNIPFYLFGDTGYSFEMGSAVSGFLMDMGVGYKLLIKRNFGLNFQVGYNLKQFNGEIYDLEIENNISCTQTRQSLTFGIGFIF